jgi:hypothetical protein
LQYGIAGTVNNCHASSTELCLDLVALFERCTK